jgi:nucleoid-associated protein YgaU
MPSESEWQTATQRRNANFGLPTQQEIRLQGTCTCRGGEFDEPSHRYELALQVAHGLLCGEALCARRGKWVAVTGSLTETRGLLHEFAIDESPTAHLSFEWRVENGVLSIEGCKSPSADESNGCDQFAVQGAVAPIVRSRHIVAQNETLSSIAVKVYGNGSAANWKRIYEANKNLIGANPDALEVGMTLVLPAP